MVAVAFETEEMALNDDEYAPWPEVDDAAYYGLPGDIVRTIEPHSEADPVALLAQILASAGNAVGRCPFYQVEGDLS